MAPIVFLSAAARSVPKPPIRWPPGSSIIHNGIVEVIRDLRPDAAAFESLFYATNVSSALKLGHVRGVSIFAAAAGESVDLRIFAAGSEKRRHRLRKGGKATGAANGARAAETGRVCLNHTMLRMLWRLRSVTSIPTDSKGRLAAYTYDSLPLFLFFFAWADFSSFTYCHDNTRGPYETQCVQLDANGKGEINFKRRAGRDGELCRCSFPSRRARSSSRCSPQRTTWIIRRPLNPAERSRIWARTAQRRDCLPENAKARSIFRFGKKSPICRHSLRRLMNQETLAFDIANAMQFERLSIPKRLEQMENEFESNRIADPERLIPVLEKIEQDSRS